MEPAPGFIVAGERSVRW
jgi:hypothetical protein